MNGTIYNFFFIKSITAFVNSVRDSLNGFGLDLGQE